MLIVTFFAEVAAFSTLHGSLAILLRGAAELAGKKYVISLSAVSAVIVTT